MQGNNKMGFAFSTQKVLPLQIGKILKFIIK